MGKQLTFEYKNKEYVLEFTRETIKQMEREGFVTEDIIKKPMLTLPKLFAGAFKAHHKFGIKQKEIEEMFDRFTNKEALLEKLAEMYQHPLETMLDEPDEKEGNVIAWDANF